MNGVKSQLGSHSWFNKTQHTLIAEALPKHPVPFPLQHWWIANLGVITEQDIAVHRTTLQWLLTPLGMLQTWKGNRWSYDGRRGQGDRQAASSCHRHSLQQRIDLFWYYSTEHRSHHWYAFPLLLSVPLIRQVPPLKDFVMNRVSGDYFENLLYTLFVSIDERTSVEKMAALLDIDPEQVKVRHKYLSPISLIVHLGGCKSIHSPWICWKERSRCIGTLSYSHIPPLTLFKASRRSKEYIQVALIMAKAIQTHFLWSTQGLFREAWSTTLPTW